MGYKVIKGDEYLGDYKPGVGYHFSSRAGFDYWVSQAKVISENGDVTFYKKGGVIEPSYSTRRKHIVP